MVLLGRTPAIVVCLFASNLWAQNRVDLEFLPGLGSDGQKPTAAMVQARDGALYGSTTKGGAHNHGTLYQVIPGANPIVKTVYSFDEETYSPAETMVAANDGRLYGVTSAWKKLYRITPQPAPVVDLLPLSFEGSADADDVLVASSDGALYGTIHGDEHGAGGVYRVTPGARPKVARVWTFNEGACSLNHEERDDTQKAGSIGKAAGRIVMIDSCQVDHLHLVAAKDGNLYGATRGAGKNHRAGFMYRVIPSKPVRVEVLRRFDGITGPWDFDSLVAATDGNLYGTTAGGGTNQLGTVFVIEPGPKPTIRTLLSIGSNFRGAKLILSGRDNSIYGVSRGDARSCGNVFMLKLGTTNLDAVFPFTSERTGEDCRYGALATTLIASRDGSFYGTVAWTGFVANQSEAPGGIFRITTGANRSATRLLSFNSEVGYVPRAPLMEASDGNLYGTTTVGGVMNSGAIFQLQPNAPKLKTLLSFTPEMEIRADSALTVGADGRLYGAASTCCGSVGIAFRVDRGDTPTASVFHRFESGSSDGGPYGSLLAGKDGYLYGLLPEGGHANTGAIYRVIPGDAPVVTPVYDFVASFGERLNVPFISDGKGNFYGTSTRPPGRSGLGTAFRVTPGAGKIASVLFTFGKQLGFPNASGFVFAADGYLYGTTYWNGEPGGPTCGTIYRLPANTPAKAEIVHAFARDECWHPSELVAASDGSLYIATLGNSSNDSGKILKISIGKSPSVSTVGYFSRGNQYTAISLYSGSKGDIYGVAAGHGDGGAIFRIRTGAHSTIDAAVSLPAKLCPDTLIPGTDGYMYGISISGGDHGLGAILRYKPGSTSVELLYSFDGKKDGAPPSTPLVERDGYFYGLTLQANMNATGLGGTGRVFRFRPPKQLTKS